MSASRRWRASLARTSTRARRRPAIARANDPTTTGCARRATVRDARSGAAGHDVTGDDSIRDDSMSDDALDVPVEDVAQLAGMRPSDRQGTAVFLQDEVDALPETTDTA